MSFPRYPAYKDSGVAWLGEVPGHWKISKLKHAATFASGGTPSKEVLGYWNGSIPWASSKDLKSDVLSDTEDHITERAVEDGARLIGAGDLMVVVRGMILAHTFPVTKALVAMAINQDLKGVRPNSGWHTDYFAALLRAASPETFRRLDEAGHGTKALRMESWVGMELPQPPLPEQHAIATFLDRETAKIDALVSEQQRLIELLKEKRQAVISHVVTKGLNPDAPMKDSGVEWIGEVPEHWSINRLKYLIREIEQGWSPQCEGYPVETNDEWGVLKVGCVNGGTFDATENKALPQELEPIHELSLTAGDLLISRANTRELVGSAAVVQHDCPNLMLCDKLYRIRLHAQRGIPAFVSRYLSASAPRGQIELGATGASSSMVNIGQSTILELFLAVPPLLEQVAIVDFIDREVTRLDTLTTEATRAIELLNERRTALISAAVTGQIDVREVTA